MLRYALDQEPKRCTEIPLSARSQAIVLARPTMPALEATLPSSFKAPLGDQAGDVDHYIVRHLSDQHVSDSSYEDMNY